MRAAEIRGLIADIIRRHAPRHLVHVGAHRGEEVPGYAGIPHVTLVEPIPVLAQQLRIRYPRTRVAECACGAHNGTATLHIPQRTNMATLIPSPGRRITVSVRRLDEVAPDADAAVVDVQGRELDVLAAAPDSLRLLVVETCTADDPVIAARHVDVEEAVTRMGFVQTAVFARDYQAVVRWATGVTPEQEGEIRDVVYVRA